MNWRKCRQKLKDSSGVLKMVHECNCCYESDGDTCSDCLYFHSLQTEREDEYVDGFYIDVIYVCELRHYIPHAYSMKCNDYRPRSEQIRVHSRLRHGDDQDDE